MAASLIFDFQFASSDAPEPAEPGQPMRILVLGDFSAGAGAGTLADRPVLPVDIDNLDHAIARLAPTLQLALDGADAPASTFRFRSLDDFHPDQLFLNAPAFQALHGQRQRLKNPATFAAAAGLMAPKRDAAPAGDFASLLGGEMRRPAKTSAAAGDIDALVKLLVGAVPGADTRQGDFLAAADAAIGERMRAVLHHPDFQRLEAAWRSVHFLVTGLELDTQLQLHIVDIGKEELRADLQAAGTDLQQSAAYRLLVERQRAAPDTPPWSVLVGDYSFGPEPDDVAMLAALGAIAAQAGAPLLAAGADRLLGCDSLAATPDPASWSAPDGDSAARWQALRASPGARWLGLALPRLLLRLPYGKQTDRVEHFDFDEYDGAHAGYLWGNAAFGCALLLGQAFQDNAWDLAPDELLDICALPAHTVRRDGAAQMQACAETRLSERATDAILRLGVMPMLSFGNRDAVRLARSQSLAAPPQPLSGPWQL